jgi:hypothetical protein
MPRSTFSERSLPAISRAIRSMQHPGLREAAIWSFALLALAFWPGGGSLGFEALGLCPLDRLGWSWCPGCGLGHGVRHALHGEWHAASAAHPLALPVLGVLGYRIATVLWRAWNTKPGGHAALPQPDPS